jgi:hypothetical protein
MKNALSGSEQWFRDMGFCENICYDTNDPKHPSHIIKFHDFKIRVDEHCFLTAVFSYENSDDQWICFETGAELQIGQQYMKLSFTHCHQFRRLYKILTGKSLTQKQT